VDEPVVNNNDNIPESIQSIFNSLQSGPYSPVAPGEPYFDASIPRNMTALVAKTAYLSCRVKNLGNRTVKKVSQFHFVLHTHTHTWSTGTQLFMTCNSTFFGARELI